MLHKLLTFVVQQFLSLKLTALFDVCSCDAGLMEVLSVNCSQRVKQRVPGCVISPITHVQAADETHQPPLAVLIHHVALGTRGGPVSWAIMPRTSSSQLFQLVLCPCTLAMRLLCACRAHHFLMCPDVVSK